MRVFFSVIVITTALPFIYDASFWIKGPGYIAPITFVIYLIAVIFSIYVFFIDYEIFKKFGKEKSWFFGDLNE